MSSKDHNMWRVTFYLSHLLILFSLSISHTTAASYKIKPAHVSDQVQTVSDTEMVSDVPDAGLINTVFEPRISASKQLQLALAKICVSESGFQVHSNDCTLIYHVLRRRSSTGEVTMGIMRAYAKKTFDEHRSDSRRWIAHLNYDLSEPRGWAESVSVPWSRRQSGFAEVYNHTGMLLRTRPTETPCGAKVSHWGARGFRRELHLSQGWELVRCGNTHNDFWYVPNRRDAEERQVESDQEVASL